MARNIKIELELPEFEKELNVSITLKRDGEVTTVTSSPATGILTEQSSGGAWKQHIIDDHTSTVGMLGAMGVPSAVGETPAMSEAAKPRKTKKTNSSAGNMMDMNF
jgi:hypothetical protein